MWNRAGRQGAGTDRGREGGAETRERIGEQIHTERGVGEGEQRHRLRRSRDRVGEGGEGGEQRSATRQMEADEG